MNTLKLALLLAALSTSCQATKDLGNGLKNTAIKVVHSAEKLLNSDGERLDFEKQDMTALMDSAFADLNSKIQAAGVGWAKVATFGTIKGAINMDIRASDNANNLGKPVKTGIDKTLEDAFKTHLNSITQRNSDFTCMSVVDSSEMINRWGVTEDGLINGRGMTVAREAGATGEDDVGYFIFGKLNAIQVDKKNAQFEVRLELVSVSGMADPIPAVATTTVEIPVSMVSQINGILDTLEVFGGLKERVSQL